MRTTTKLKLFLVLFLLQSTNGSAQDFILDTTFCPTYDFHGILDYFWVGYIVEKDDGSIYLAGDFGDNPEVPYTEDIGRFLPNGSLDTTFCFLTGPSVRRVILGQHSIYLNFGMGGIVNKVDEFGNQVLSFYNNSGLSYYGVLNDFTLLPDSNLLVCGEIFPENIYSAYSDRGLARLWSDGLLDTTFQHDANDVIWRIEKYDNTRVLLSGRFTAYDGYPINKLCRIHNDGTIDTTFHSIFTSENLWNHISPLHVQDDGKVILGGYFKLINNLNLTRSSGVLNLIRLNPDGSLDSTFNNFNNVDVTINENTGAVFTGFTSVCLTDDNHYILGGGGFSSYQGYPRTNMVLTDIDGNIIPSAFNGTGFEHTIMTDIYISVGKIIRSLNNEYYVAGSFDKFNGDSVPPIVRLKKITTGVIEPDSRAVLTVFPNPATSILQISSISSIDEIEIYNLSGCRIWQVNELDMPASIDISGFESGTYILKARCGNDYSYRKIVFVR